MNLDETVWKRISVLGDYFTNLYVCTTFYMFLNSSLGGHSFAVVTKSIETFSQ